MKTSIRERRHALRPTAPVNALPIPAACQQLNGDINESNMELQDLQTELEGATKPDRARILREIRTVTAQLEAQQTEMDQCLALHAPPDGTVLKGKAKPEVYVIFGGAKFWIPTPEELIEYYGGWANVEVVRQRLIDLLPNIPAEGTLLRERSSAPVYVVAQGRTRWIPDPQTFTALGFDWGSVAVIPDASLAHNEIPNGMALPRFLPVQVGTNIGLGGGGSMYAPSISPWFPNLMLLACDMGGLYRSTNNGQTWQMIDGRDMRGSTRCAAAFHPDGTNHPDTVYCFAKGRDIRISNDRGLTWGSRNKAPLDVGDPNVGGEVTALAVDPKPPTSSTSPWRLYAGTDTQGAFYSDNYGSGAPTWTAVTLDPPPQDIVGFVFLKDPAPGPSRYLYFVATRNAVYYQDSTGGAWTKIIANLPSPLTIRSFSGGVDTSANRVALYVVTPSQTIGSAMGAGGPYACVQPGGSPWTSPAWTRLNNPTLDVTVPPPPLDQYAACPNLPQYHWVSAVPSNPSHVYVTACGTAAEPTFYTPGTPKLQSHHSGVYRSQNGGLAWEHVYYYVDKNWLGNPPNPNPPNPAPKPVLADANITGGWVDWDSTWGSGGPAGTPDLSAGWHGGFCVGQQNGADCAIFVNDQACYVTFDAASTWQESYTRAAAAAAPSQPWQSIGLEVTTTWQYYIDAHDPQSRYLCYTDIGFAFSTDGGKTWHHNGNAYQGTYPMSNAYELAFDPLIGKQIWAAGAQQHDIPRYTQLAGFFSDDLKTHWFDLESGGAVVLTTDGGTTWTDLTTANMSNGLPRKVTLSAFQNNTPPMVPPVVSLVVDQAFRYATADWRNRRLWASLFGAGVYYSADGGQTWQSRSAGLPTDNQHVYRLEFRPDGTFQADGVTPNGWLYCAVVGKNVPSGNDPTAPPPGDYSSGLYASQDRGQTWSNITPFASIQPPLPGSKLYRLVDYAVRPTDPNQAYICTDQTQSGVNQASGVYQGTKSAGAWTWTQKMSSATVGPSAWPWLAAFAPFFDPSDVSGRTVYVGTLTHGFWVTTDAGATWQPAFTDVPFLPSHRVTFDSGNPGNRYLTTYGGGAWAEIGANPSPATWTKLAPAAAPSGRIAATMGFDGGNILLFGGYNNGSILGDTWRWDGQVWTNLTPALARSPTARWSGAMAYDPARGNLMLFSGSSSVQELDDTWTWSAGTWTQAMPAKHPPGRVDATMAFDGTGVILFGGNSTGTTLLNDTWRWDGHSWASLQPPAAPPVRRLAAMCYDAARGQVVLFGGNDNASSLSSLGDTWLWNGTVWTQVAGSGPPPRFGAVMTYNPARRAVILFGGENSQGALSDTWTWDGVNWTQQSPSSAPPSLLYGGFAFDVNRSGCVLFSGWGPGGVYWTDTWLYQ